MGDPQTHRDPSFSAFSPIPILPWFIRIGRVAFEPNQPLAPHDASSQESTSNGHGMFLDVSRYERQGELGPASPSVRQV